MISIDVFVLPGCARCSAGLDALKAVATSFGPEAFAWQERDLLQSIDDAVRLGILSSPAIAINDKLVFTSLPSPMQLRDALNKHVGA